LAEGVVCSVVASFRFQRLAVRLAASTALVSAPAAALAAGAPHLTPNEVHYWTTVGACETGAGGPPKWDWGTKHRPGEGTLYQGGLGISALMWTEWAGELGLLTRYPDAYDAPSLVQMEVAQYGVSTHHAVWGCKGSGS
jgi:hypothetical protein